MIVLNSPGSNVVRPVWNYLVLALVMEINFEESLFREFVVKSATEHKAKLRASLNWA